MAQKNYPAAAVVLYKPDAKALDQLLSPLDQNGRRLFIFVNGALEAEIEARLKALTNGRLIRSAQNVGHGQGLNASVEAAREEGFENIVLLDQDSTPEPDIIERLSDRFAELKRSYPQIAVLGPLLVAPSGENFLPQKYLWRTSTLNEPDRAVDFVPTSGSLVSIQAWMDVGPFRSNYFIGSIDVEWSLRAWSRGFMCAVACDLQMIHRWGPAVSAAEAHKPQILRQADMRNYYFFRNAVDCLKLSYIPLRWRLRYATILVGQIGLLMCSRRFSPPLRALLRRAIADGWNGRFGPIPSDITIDS